MAGALLAGFAARADQEIFADNFQNGWFVQPWAATALTNSPLSPNDGALVMAVNCGPFEALDLRAPAFDASPYANLIFWLHGGAAGGQSLSVQALLNGIPQAAFPLPELLPNVWTNFVIPLAALGASNSPALNGFYIYNFNDAAAPTFFVADVSLQARPGVVRPSFVAGASRSDGQVGFSLAGAPGQKFVLQTSTNLANWQPVSTNTFGSAPFPFVVAPSSPRQFYRATTAP
jgi:hypothetical protein